MGELGLATAADTEILDHALRHGRTIVTLDADFHALLATHNARGPSVLRVRLERLRGPEAAEPVSRSLSQRAVVIGRARAVVFAHDDVDQGIERVPQDPRLVAGAADLRGVLLRVRE